MSWEELAVKAEFKELVKIAGEESFSEEDKQAIIERVKEKLKGHGVSDSHADNLILEGDLDEVEDAEVVASTSSKMAASIVAEEESLSDLGFTKDTEITSDNIDQIMNYFKGEAQEDESGDSADEIVKSLGDVFDRIKLFVDSLGNSESGESSEGELVGEDKKIEASLKCAEKSILSDFIVGELVKYAKRFEYQSELDRYMREHPDADKSEHSYDKKGESGKGRPRNSKLWPTKSEMESYLDKHPKADKTKHQYEKGDSGRKAPKMDEGGKSKEDGDLDETRKKIKDDKKLVDREDESESKSPDEGSVAESPEKQEEVRKKIEDLKENAKAEKSGEKPSADLEDSHVERDTPHWFNKDEKINPLNESQMGKKGFNKGSSELKDDDIFYDVRTGKAHKFSELPEKVREKLMEKSANNELWHSRERNNNKDKYSKKTKKEVFTDQVEGLKKDLSKNIVDNEKEIRDTMVDDGKVIGDLFSKFREEKNKEIFERNEDRLNDVLFDKGDKAYHFDVPQPESDSGMLPSARKPRVNDSVKMKSQRGKGPAWSVEKIEGDTAFLRNEKTDQVMQSPLNQLEFDGEAKKKKAPKKKITMKDFLKNVPNEEGITDKERKIVEKLFQAPEKKVTKKKTPKEKDLVEKITDKIAPAQKKRIEKIDNKLKKLENEPVDLNDEDHTEIEKLHSEKKVLEIPKEEVKEKPPVGNSRRVKPKPSARLQKIGEGDYQHEGMFNHRIQKSGGRYNVSTKNGGKVLPSRSFKSLAEVRSWIGSVNAMDITFDGKDWQGENVKKESPEKKVELKRDMVEKITDKIAPKKDLVEKESPKKKVELKKKVEPKKDVVEKVTDKIAPKKENTFKDFEEVLDPKTVSKIRNTYGDGVNDHINDYLESNNVELDKQQQDGLWERVDSLGMEEIGSGSYNEQSSLERIENRLPFIVNTITKPKKKVDPKKDVVEKITDNIAPKKKEAPESQSKASFMKGSKAVDKSGKPISLYHGTPASFDNFSLDDFGKTDMGRHGKAINFTTDDSVAGRYGDTTKKVNISLKNPLEIKSPSDLSKFLTDADHSRIKKLPFEERAHAMEETRTKNIKAEGYDGIIERDTMVSNEGKPHDMYSVFDPSQISIIDSAPSKRRKQPKKEVVKKEAPKKVEKKKTPVKDRVKTFEDFDSFEDFEKYTEELESKKEAPKKDIVEKITDKIAPKKETPKKETPKKEAPKKEAPKLKKKLSPEGEKRRNVLEERVKSIDKKIEDAKGEIEQNEEVGLLDNVKSLRDRVKDLHVTRKNVNKAIEDLGKAPSKVKKEEPKAPSKVKNEESKAPSKVKNEESKAPSKVKKDLVDKITDKITPKDKGEPKKKAPAKKDVVKKVTEKIAPKKEKPTSGNPLVDKANEAQKAKKSIYDSDNAKQMYDEAKKKHDDYKVKKTNGGKVVKKTQKHKDDLKKDVDQRKKKMDDAEKKIPAEFKNKTLSDVSKLTNKLYDEIKKETPKKETPKKETPKKETPKKETPKKETPKKETPKKETPKKETPKKETPKKETPKKETPKKETPKKETPKKESPKKDLVEKITEKIAPAQKKKIEKIDKKVKKLEDKPVDLSNEDHNEIEKLHHEKKTLESPKGHYDSLKSIDNSADRMKYIKEQMADKSLSREDKKNIHTDYSKLMKEEKDDFSSQLMKSKGSDSKTKNLMDHMTKTRGKAFAEGIEKTVNKRMKDGEAGKLIKQIMDNQGNDAKLNKIMDKIIKDNGEDFADGIGDMVKSKNGKIPVRETTDASFNMGGIEADVFLEGLTDRLVEAVKDRDLMRDTGGQSKMRDREPHNKPPREDCKNRYKEKRLTPNERDTDTNNDKDLN